MAYVAIAVVAVLFLIILIGGITHTTGYNGALKEFFTSIETGNSTKYINSVIPQACRDEILGNLDYSNKDFKIACKDALDTVMDGLEDEYGKHVTIKYSIEDRHELTSKRISELEDNIEYMFGEGVSVKKAYRLDVLATIKGREDKIENEQQFIVYKTREGWFVYDNSFAVYSQVVLSNAGDIFEW